jgi:multicomponent Na+:H+ antiporter subunit G
MTTIFGSISLLLGAFFILVASVGLLRMPDLMMRMHATTKAGTLGAGLMAVGMMFFFPEISVWTRAIALILFVILTAPVAAHMIGRAAYYSGVPLWKDSIVDELHDYRDTVIEQVERRLAEEKSHESPSSRA